MFQTQLIHQVLEWERRLEIDEQRRKNQRFEPYMNYLAPVRACVKERESIFAWIFRRAKAQDRQPAEHGYPQECCQETQPG